MDRKANRLSKESSPYLLQHANNPVDWFPWGPEALQKAKRENKPILVSIGYAACHWCHVMEKESFEDEATAEIMNEHFVNIKIDREERPDLDHIYMDAVQTMTGSGGWPLNVFLTPDCKPFYGGTYFPPVPLYNRPSWQDVLLGISGTFRQKPDEVLTQAENLLANLVQANSFGLQSPLKTSAPAFTEESLRIMYENIIKASDKQQGGFGHAPKFPQTFTIHYLLSYYQHTKNEDALRQACLSLDKMIQGGIYDQLGGGFSRYATDNNWLIPHFEKMLYDNALLIMVISEAWQLTHKELYLRTLKHCISYVKLEMLSPEYGFYAALDADSEGVEGKFYVWTHDEVQKLLGEEALLFCEFYDVSEKGNWEGKNILNNPVTAEEFAKQKNMSLESLLQRLEKSSQLVLEERKTRVRPQLDDKILLGWNCLMNTALSKAYAALGDEDYKQLAIKNMDFIWQKLRDEDNGSFFHTYKYKESKYPAFLDDYAYLVQALLHLQEITGDPEYLQKALQISDTVIENFSAEESGLFYFTARSQEDVIIRKMEIYDGAIPSGNSIMAWNLLYLAVIFDRKDWQERVVKMLNSIAGITIKYPTSFAVWASLLMQSVEGINELVMTGLNHGEFLKQILHIFMPNKVLQVSAYANNNFPLLKGKVFTYEPLLYLCRNYTCLAPVTEVNSLMVHLENYDKIP
ncbi:MAG: thioredoxin domain-containing protein [Chitinophagaceae bacterium]